jgi:putative DNA primase/helicase
MFYEYDADNERLTINDWGQLLIADGFPTSLFNRKHQQCPVCNKADAFRAGYKPTDGDFFWVCKDCTSSHYSGGYELLRLYHNLGNGTDVYRHIYQRTLANESRIQHAMQQPKQDLTDPAELLRKSIRTNSFLWDKSRPVQVGDPVWKYLKKREPRLVEVPAEIHYSKAQYWESIDDKPVMVGEFDAMLIRGYSPCNKFVQIHTTYLTPNGDKANVKNQKKTRPGNGFNSFAFRMNQVGEDGVLGLSEGLETAFSANVMYGIPVWACHSASILENFEIPEHLIGVFKKIIIFADNDRSQVNGGIRNTGLIAARNLAKKLRQKYGVKVVVMMTPSVGDFNDLSKRQAAVMQDQNPEPATNGRFGHAY